MRSYQKRRLAEGSDPRRRKSVPDFVKHSFRVTIFSLPPLNRRRMRETADPFGRDPIELDFGVRNFRGWRLVECHQ